MRLDLYSKNLAYKIPDDVRPQEVLPLYSRAWKEWLEYVSARVDDYTGQAKIELDQYAGFMEQFEAKQIEMEVLAAAAGVSCVKAVRAYINGLGRLYPELNFHYHTREFMNAVKAYDAGYDYSEREYLPVDADIVIYEPAGLYPNWSSSKPGNAQDWFLVGEWSRLKDEYGLSSVRMAEIRELLRAGRRDEVPELQSGYDPATGGNGNAVDVVMASISPVMKNVLLAGGALIVLSLLKAK